MKRKILACVLACATLFLGMGYAFWTDSLQINTTADTGELEVKFVDLDYFGAYGDENGWAVYTGAPNHEELATSLFSDNNYNRLANDVDITNYWKNLEKYTKTTFSAIQLNPIPLSEPPRVDNDYRTGTMTSDVINVNITDMYPGYAQLFRTDILNTGTIAAKLADIKLAFHGTVNENLRNMIGVSLNVIYENGAKVNVLKSDDSFTIDGLKFVRLSALDNITWDKGSDNLLYIYPDDKNTMDAIFGVAMDPDYDGYNTTGHVGIDPSVGDDLAADYDYATQGKSVNFTIDFLWDQFNVDDPYTNNN